MSTSPTLHFTKRLEECVHRSGGKRALAAISGISEAQLYRYLTGESILPTDRLEAIAKAAHVDSAWLLTGRDGPEGPVAKDPRPSFRPELMMQVIQLLDDLLMESNRQFTPRQRSVAVTLIYEALRLNEVRKGSITAELDRRLAPFYPDFLAPLRQDPRMMDYMSSMAAMEYGGDVSMQTMKLFDSLVRLAMVGVYEGAAGELHFEKMGTALLPEASRRLLTITEMCVKLIGKSRLDWLDAGCGNGRHLAFLSTHTPFLNLHGIEASRLALNLCQNMVRTGKLPEGVVVEGDFRSLPYTDASMDVVYCRLGLEFLPDFGTDDMVGAVQFLSEAKRVLRPGGLMVVLTYAGEGRSYVPFVQYHNTASMQSLAGRTGLEVVQIDEGVPVNETGGVAGKDFSSNLKDGLQAILRKPS